MSLRSYEPHSGTIGTLTPGISGRGVERPMYQYDYEQDTNHDIDDYVDDLLLKIDGELDDKIKTKIGANYTGGTDSYRPRGSSAYTVGNNHILEFGGDHKNVARKGMSPYRYPKFSGPPLGSGGSNQAFKTTGNFIGKGTQYGSSRPHKIMTDLEDEAVHNLDDILKPFDRSWRRHQRRVKKVLNYLKENFKL